MDFPWKSTLIIEERNQPDGSFDKHLVFSGFFCCELQEHNICNGQHKKVVYPGCDKKKKKKLQQWSLNLI